MNDTDVRDILARALPDHARLTRITRDSAVAAGRLAASRRRLGTATAIIGVFCLVLIGATTVSLSLGRGLTTVDSAVGSPSSSAPLATRTATETHSSSPRTPGPSLAPITEPPPETVAASARLRAAAQSLLADATFSSISVGFDDGAKTMAPFGIYPNGHGYYIATAVISRPSTEGTFAMTMFADGANPKAPDPGCTPGFPSSLGCEVRTGPHGETLTVQKGAWEGVEGVLQYQVMVHRTDGVILSATVTNTTSTNPSYEYRASAPPNQVPPISTDQLVDLLLTPGLDPP